MSGSSVPYIYFSCVSLLVVNGSVLSESCVPSWAVLYVTLG